MPREWSGRIRGDGGATQVEVDDQYLAIFSFRARAAARLSEMNDFPEPGLNEVTIITRF